MWSILEPVFRAGETYAYPRDITEDDARRTWTSSPKEVFVAEESGTGQILGTYYLKPNHEGPGAHVCNCGYVVSLHARGRGLAAQMCEHSQREAVSRGFRAMHTTWSRRATRQPCTSGRRWGSPSSGRSPARSLTPRSASLMPT